MFDRIKPKTPFQPNQGQLRDLVENFPNLTYKTYHIRMLLYRCESRPREILRGSECPFKVNWCKSH